MIGGAAEENGRGGDKKKKKKSFAVVTLWSLRLERFNLSSGRHRSKKNYKINSIRHRNNGSGDTDRLAQLCRAVEGTKNIQKTK